jgi:hypothetical protein
VAAGEAGEQLRVGAAAGPEAPHHPAESEPKLRQLLLVSYHWVTIIGREVNRMCGGHHHGRRGRHGFPSREQLVERLQGYREHLQQETAKVEELLERLADAPSAPTAQ